MLLPRHPTNIAARTGNTFDVLHRCPTLTGITIPCLFIQFTNIYLLIASGNRLTLVPSSPFLPPPAAVSHHLSSSSTLTSQLFPYTFTTTIRLQVETRPEPLATAIAPSDARVDSWSADMHHAMRHHTSPLHSLLLKLIIALLLPSSLATNVALSDFTPRADITDPSCKAIYNAPVLGCEPGDFSASGMCSRGCIDALNGLQQTVAKACPSITGPNLLKAAVDGQLSVNICKNGVSIAPILPASATPATPATPAATNPVGSAPSTSAFTSMISSLQSSLPSVTGFTSTLPSSSSLTVSLSTLTLTFSVSPSPTRSLSTITLTFSGVSEPGQTKTFQELSGGNSQKTSQIRKSTMTSSDHSETGYYGTPLGVTGSAAGGPTYAPLLAIALALLSGLALLQ